MCALTGVGLVGDRAAAPAAIGKYVQTTKSSATIDWACHLKGPDADVIVVTHQPQQAVEHDLVDEDTPPARKTDVTKRHLQTGSRPPPPYHPTPSPAAVTYGNHGGRLRKPPLLPHEQLNGATDEGTVAGANITTCSNETAQEVPTRGFRDGVNAVRSGDTHKPCYHHWALLWLRKTFWIPGSV